MEYMLYSFLSNIKISEFSFNKDTKKKFLLSWDNMQCDDALVTFAVLSNNLALIFPVEIGEGSYIP